MNKKYLGQRFGIALWIALTFATAYNENWRWFAIGATGAISWMGALIVDILENR